jgi:hypothetical protein
LDLYVEDIFPRYFKIYTKEETHKTKEEVSIVSAIISFFKEIAQFLKRRQGIDFDRTQFLFITPIEWHDEKYEGYLRPLFFEAGWVTQQDHKNRLIFSPFLDCYVNLLRNINDINYQRDFKRERKYLICSMVPNIETDSITFSLICFQMQNAKELSAVSKKLATGELLLTPTILHTEAIELPSLKNLIKEIVSKNAKINATETIAAAKPRNILKDGIRPKRKHLHVSRRIKEKLHDVYDAISYKAKEKIGYPDEKFISLIIEDITKELPSIYTMLVRHLKL